MSVGLTLKLKVIFLIIGTENIFKSEKRLKLTKFLTFKELKEKFAFLRLLSQFMLKIFFTIF